MKILHVIPYFYPAWRFGGPVRVAYDVCRKLVERGHSVTVYTSDVLSDNARVERCYRRVSGIDVFYFKNMSLPATKHKIYITPSLLAAVKDNIESFDIVHIHGNRTTQSPILHYFLRKASVPYVVQAHGGLLNLSKQKVKQIYDLMFGTKLLKDAAKVIALTRLEAQQYECMGVPPNRIEIVPNGIDQTEYSNYHIKGSFKMKHGIGEDEKIVLYVGRLNQSKGLSFLAKAFSLVSQKHDNVRLVLVGPDDGYAKEFSALLSHLGIQNKTLLTGFLDTTEKLAALHDSDVFVTPFYFGFPVTFLEACMAGCPIVTANDELGWIHNNVGFVTGNSPSEFAEAVSLILSDKALRERFRNNCSSTIKDFDLSNVVDQLEKVYDAAIGCQIACAGTSVDAIKMLSNE